MDQQIHFCTTSDGVSIAYATLGSGPPLVYVTGWPGHLAVEWEKSVSREFISELAQGFTLIRYDMRGSGLSERDVSEFSLATFVRDLEAVVDHLALKRLTLLSLGFLAGPIAISYAAEHPDRVARLVLSSAYLRGADLTTPERGQALVEYIANFGFPLNLSQFDLPESNIERWREVGVLQRAGASKDMQAAVARIMLDADVTEAAARLSMPALILHGRADTAVPFKHGRDLAALVSHAEFVPFEASSAAPWAEQQIIIPEIRRFLGTAQQGDKRQPTVDADIHTILFTDIESSTALTQRLGDAQAQELVRAHNAIVREALASHGGSEIKHTGDGIMASFPSASRALECAITIQRSVEARDPSTSLRAGPRPHDTLRVHIGLNAGEPVAEERDLFGAAVQLARRICDQAEAEQILVSDVVRQLAAGKGFLFSDIGEVIPKGFDEAVRLFEVRWRDEPLGSP